MHIDDLILIFMGVCLIFLIGVPGYGIRELATTCKLAWRLLVPMVVLLK